MFSKAALAVDFDADHQMIEDIEEIRKWRLLLAQKQLLNAESTVNELISRGLIEDGDRSAYVLELKQELADKIIRLQGLSEGGRTLHLEEVELYLHSSKA